MSEQCNSPGELHVPRSSRRLSLPLHGDPPAPLCAPLAPAPTPGSPSLSTGNASPPASLERLTSVENPALTAATRIELNTGLCRGSARHQALLR